MSSSARRNGAALTSPPEEGTLPPTTKATTQLRMVLCRRLYVGGLCGAPRTSVAPRAPLTPPTMSSRCRRACPHVPMVIIEVVPEEGRASPQSRPCHWLSRDCDNVRRDRSVAPQRLPCSICHSDASL